MLVKSILRCAPGVSQPSVLLSANSLMLRSSFSRVAPKIRSKVPSPEVAKRAEAIAKVVVPELSIIRHPFSLNGEELKPTTLESTFAVVEMSGTQHKVTVDDVIVADKIANVDIGETVTLDKVLLVGSKKTTLLGHPTIAGAVVTAQVEEQAKDHKVIIFKTRRRKNSKSLRGFRRQVTILRVTDIKLSAEDQSRL